MTPAADSRYLTPNVVTSARLIIVLAGSILLVFDKTFYVGFALFLVGVMTDRLDGYIARRHGLGSEFGKIYDQVCDKIVAVFVMSALVYMGLIPVWLMALVVVRDYIAGIIRDYSMVQYDTVLSAHWLAKRKTDVNGIAVILILLLWKFDIAFEVTSWILYVLVIVVNYASLIPYCMDLRHRASKESTIA